MKILGIETATDACSAALLCDAAISHRLEIAPRRHTDIILSMVADLLAEAQLQLSQIDAIAFGCGPGSFMGIRLATGIAQGLAFGIDCPVISVSSLQALSQVAYIKHKTKQVIAAWDARMEAVYWGAYSLQGNLMQPLQADQLSQPMLIKPPTADVYVAVGNAWEIYANQFSSGILAKFPAIYVDLYPAAQGVVCVAQDKFQRGDVMPAASAKPIYLRNQVAKKPL